MARSVCRVCANSVKRKKAKAAQIEDFSKFQIFDIRTDRDYVYLKLRKTNPLYFTIFPSNLHRLRGDIDALPAQSKEKEFNIDLIDIIIYSFCR